MQDYYVEQEVRPLNDQNSACKIATRFYINAVIATPLCLVGLVGSILSYVALGLDTEIAPVTSLTLRTCKRPSSDRSIGPPGERSCTEAGQPV